MNNLNLQKEQDNSAFDQMLKRAEADAKRHEHSSEDELRNLADDPRALIEDFQESLTDNRPDATAFDTHSDSELSLIHI